MKLVDQMQEKRDNENIKALVPTTSLGKSLSEPTGNTAISKETGTPPQVYDKMDVRGSVNVG